MWVSPAAQVPSAQGDFPDIGGAPDSSIRAHVHAGRVTCLTLCLIPDEDYPGRWAKAEALGARACAVLGI